MALMTGSIFGASQATSKSIFTHGLLNQYYPTRELKRIPDSLDATNIQILSLNGLTLHINILHYKKLHAALL